MPKAKYIGNSQTIEYRKDVIATNKTFMTVEEVAEILGSSKSFAYKTIQRLNGELAAKGITI